MGLKNYVFLNLLLLPVGVKALEPVKVVGDVTVSSSPVNIKIVDNTGTPYGVKQVDGKIRVSDMPYLYDIAEGNVSGHAGWMKIGFTPAMTTSDSDVWSKGGSYVFPVISTQMAVVSSDNTQDTATGTGCQKVIIYYLDEAWAEQTTTVTLTGTTPALTTPTNIYRVNGFRVYEAGSTGKPLGNISLTSSGGGITYSYITAGYTRARNCAYTVPAGKTLYVISILFSFGYAANQTHFARIYTRATQNEGVRTPGIFYPFTEAICANSSEFIPLLIPTKIVEKVDIKVSGISTFTGSATVALRGWLE